KPFLFEASKNEPIDFIFGPASVLNRRRGSWMQRLEGPECASCRVDCVFTLRRDLRRAGLRPHGTGSNPLGDRFDLISRELAAFRHLERTGLSEGSDKDALVRVAGDDGRTRFAASEHGFSRIEAKPT